MKIFKPTPDDEIQIDNYRLVISITEGGKLLISIDHVDIDHVRDILVDSNLKVSIG